MSNLEQLTHQAKWQAYATSADKPVINPEQMTHQALWQADTPVEQF